MLLVQSPDIMADVRSLLRNERAARRITHPHAIYSTKGALVCTVCNTQLKSESLWEGHLRSTQHAMKLQKLKDSSPALSTPLVTTPANGSLNAATYSTETIKRKRTRVGDESPETARKRSRGDGLPEGFFDNPADEPTASDVEVSAPQEMQLPSRPATPSKTTPPLPSSSIPALPAKEVAPVDEDEWAAFEADIAAAELVTEDLNTDAVISAAPMTAEQLAAKAREDESAQRKERHDAEMEGDKEDAARKLEEEFEEMNELENRVRKLKERREELRAIREAGDVKMSMDTTEIPSQVADEEDDDDDDDDDDEWDGFRMRM